MTKINKNETKKILTEIFNYFENGDSNFEGHPAFYFFHSKEELAIKTNELLNKNEYDQFDLYYIASELIKLMLDKYDSHTKISFKNNIYLPLDFKIDNNKVYITSISPLYQKVIGYQVIAINGIDIRKILYETEKIICYSTKEHLLAVTQSFLSDSNILKSLPSMNNDTEKFAYTVSDSNGELIDIIFDINNLPKEPYNVQIPENYLVETINDCYIIHYNSCKDKEKMNQLILNLKQHNDINNYIIDLRYNGGGNSAIIKPLIKFLKNKNIVVLVNEYVFSSGRMALVELKKIGAYIIGTDIGTSLNCFGNYSSCLDIDKLNLKAMCSSTYWYYDKKLSVTGYEKEQFITYFNNKKELLEPIVLHPDKYVYLTKDQIIKKHDSQMIEAIHYLKEQNQLFKKLNISKKKNF